MTDDRSHDLAASSGSYVLHGLDAEESTAFERLLEHSDALRAEVAELTDTAVELGLSTAPEAPRPELRAALLDAIAQTPQLPAAPPQSVAPVTDIRTAGTGAGRRRLLRPIAIAVSAAAAAAIVGGVVVGVVLPTTPAGRIAAVQSASDSRTQSMPVAGGGTIEVSWSAKEGAAVATSRGLPALSGGRVYEFWYLTGDGAHPAGTSDGTGTTVLDGRMVDGSAIAVTIEPHGGSTTPSSAPIASVTT